MYVCGHVCGCACVCLISVAGGDSLLASGLYFSLQTTQRRVGAQEGEQGGWWWCCGGWEEIMERGGDRWVEGAGRRKNRGERWRMCGMSRRRTEWEPWSSNNSNVCSRSRQTKLHELTREDWWKKKPSVKGSRQQESKRHYWKMSTEQGVTGKKKSSVCIDKSLGYCFSQYIALISNLYVL